MNEAIVVLGVVVAYYAALLTLKLAECIVGAIEAIRTAARKL